MRHPPATKFNWTLNSEALGYILFSGQKLKNGNSGATFPVDILGRGSYARTGMTEAEKQFPHSARRVK
jgi:hypothetical protein